MRPCTKVKTSGVKPIPNKDAFTGAIGICRVLMVLEFGVLGVRLQGLGFGAQGLGMRVNMGLYGGYVWYIGVCSAWG